MEATHCSGPGCTTPVYNRKRGLCRNCYARFLHHGSPERHNAPHGSGQLRSDGYVRVHVRGEGRRALQHRLVAERALGKALPEFAVVHHVDGNRANNAAANLVICPSEEYHRLLHRRQAALAACGHADWVKCRICDKYSPPTALAMRGNYHLACRRAEYRRAA